MMKNEKIILSAIAAISLSFAAAVPAFAEEAAVESSAMETFYTGVWTKKSFKASGSWSIYADGGKTYVKLSDDFRTRNAPDLKIFLSPLAASETNGKNATDGSVMISPLASNKGEQVYEIPDGVDLASFKSILIHCERYAKLWSAADLT